MYTAMIAGKLPIRCTPRTPWMPASMMYSGSSRASPGMDWLPSSEYSSGFLPRNDSLASG